MNLIGRTKCDNLRCPACGPLIYRILGKVGIILPAKLTKAAKRRINRGQYDQSA